MVFTERGGVWVKYRNAFQLFTHPRLFQGQFVQTHASELCRFIWLPFCWVAHAKRIIASHEGRTEAGFNNFWCLSVGLKSLVKGSAYWVFSWTLQSSDEVNRSSGWILVPGVEVSELPNLTSVNQERLQSKSQMKWNTHLNSSHRIWHMMFEYRKLNDPCVTTINLTFTPLHVCVVVSERWRFNTFGKIS